MINYTQQQVNDIIQMAQTEAHNSALEFFNDRMQGEDRGCCGFAWVVFTGIKGNTKLGKMLKAAGITQNWQRQFHIWNPAKLGVQNIDTLEAGAQAASRVLNSYGFNTMAQSRLD